MPPSQAERCCVTDSTQSPDYFDIGCLKHWIFEFFSLPIRILLPTQQQDNHMLSQSGCGELWAPVSPSCCPSASSPFLGRKPLCFTTLSTLMAWIWTGIFRSWSQKNAAQGRPTSSGSPWTLFLSLCRTSGRA